VTGPNELNGLKELVSHTVTARIGVRDLLPFIIAGLTLGSVYALAGVGLVLTYKTSGVFNFAHGAMATVSGYTFYSLNVEHGMPWLPAWIVSVFVVGPLLGLIMERIVRRLSSASLSLRIAATVGCLLIIQSLIVIFYGTVETRTVPQYLPVKSIHIGSTVLTSDRIIIFVIGVVATAALYIYFRVARTGIAMRAVVSDPDLLDISGTSPVTTRRTAWVIGATFASASGVLLVPFITLDATTLTFLVVAAFGAAAIGGFRSLPGTYAGGLAIGVAASLATMQFTNGPLVGLPPSLPFLVLFVVLLVSPRRRLIDRAPAIPRATAAWTGPWQVQTAFGAALLIFLCFVPNIVGYHLSDWTQFLAITVLFLSLGLLVRTSGQVSLCHITFMAIGVSVFSHLAVDHRWPWGLALLTAGLFVVPIGALLAIPAIRLSGLYLALATFGFGLLVQYMFYSANYMFGSIGLGLTVPLPRLTALGLTQSDRSYYYLCLVIALAVTGLVIAINRSRLGRLLRALADSPTGLVTSGTSVNVTRVLVFCLSAFLAVIAGVLQAGAIGQATSDSYEPITSLLFFVLVVISLGGAPWYAMGAAIGVTLIPSYITNPNTTNWLAVLFGLSAVIMAITLSHTELSPRLRQAIDRLVGRDKSPATTQQVLQPVSTKAAVERVTPGYLQVEDLRVQFGGLVAVDCVTVHAPTGRITGLIGPNGAGKTTLFNACSGLITPSRGDVRLDDTRVSGLSPSARARRGLGRTFQQMELFDTLTVRENVALGYEASLAGPNAMGHFASSRPTQRRVQAATHDALRQCDLTELADRTAGSLSTGQRRLVEFARCLAGPFRILLLDEPSSGLDRVETARFGEIVRRVVEERGIGVVLVEHDMALVTDVCDFVYVLDFGKLVFEGTVTQVLHSPVVRAAYLGGSDVTAASASASDSESLGDRSA
jgi:ABC-type branched-subunit amino acid transport system ATPase component/branched-subunit amino acid ABC-type transport system permease component